MPLVAKETSEGVASQRTAQRFYRPELDVLRFFAFLAVFTCHGPGPAAIAPPGSWQHQVQMAYFVGVQAGAFGLQIFFLLSSYLITELLLRELESTRTIHLKAFYVRRTLRIWPLYYLGVAFGIANGFLIHHHLTTHQILFLVLFVGWLGRGTYHNGVGQLWSISVEELFYLIWPNVAKFGGEKSIVRASILIIPLAFVTLWVAEERWYNPLVQFLFFSLGALLAVVLRRWPIALPLGWRIVFAVVAMSAWCLAAEYIGAFWGPMTRPQGLASYGLIAIGCILIFLSLFALPQRYVPRPLVYLGKISYGLYVFHPLGLWIAGKIAPFAPYVRYDPVRIFEIYVVGLVATIGIATLSYYRYEKPFLRLKERFMFVPSRTT